MTMGSLWKQTSFRRALGFTLVELLVVMAVIACLMAVSSMGTGHVLRAMALTNAGNKVTQIIETARQQALTRNAMTAVVLLKGMGTPVDGRAFTVIEYTHAGSWRQVREWDSLPEGIAVDLNAGGLDGSFFTNGPQPFPFAGDAGDGAPVAYGSHLSLPANAFAARIFLPGGGLLNPDVAAQFRLVEGTVVNGGIQYTQLASTGGPANYYRIILLGATGKTKVERP